METPASPTPPLAVEDVCRPVYGPVPAAPSLSPVPGLCPEKGLVVTPWMLLDGLKEAQEEAERLLQMVEAKQIGTERRFGVPVNPVAEHAERLHFTVSHLLRLLWRGGLWTEDSVEQMLGADGRMYTVLREPFTDGKPLGRPLDPHAPQWQRELLGVTEVPPQADEPNAAHTWHEERSAKDSEIAP